VESRQPLPRSPHRRETRSRRIPQVKVTPSLMEESVVVSFSERKMACMKGCWSLKVMTEGSNIEVELPESSPDVLSLSNAMFAKRAVFAIKSKSVGEHSLPLQNVIADETSIDPSSEHLVIFKSDII